MISFTFEDKIYEVREKTNWYTFAKTTKDFWCASLRDEVNTRDNWLVSDTHSFDTRVYGYTEIKDGGTYSKVDF
jgi:hypothetical protein